MGRKKRPMGESEWVRVRVRERERERPLHMCLCLLAYQSVWKWERERNLYTCVYVFLRTRVCESERVTAVCVCVCARAHAYMSASVNMRIRRALKDFSHWVDDDKPPRNEIAEARIKSCFSWLLHLPATPTEAQTSTSKKKFIWKLSFWDSDEGQALDFLSFDQMSLGLMQPIRF